MVRMTDRPIEVVRYDRGEYRRAIRLDNGVLRADAVPTKAGVFAYKNADGSIRRELRRPEEVFHSDSLATLEGSVITLGHPPKGTVAGSVRDLQRGHLGTDVARDGDLVRASAFVTDSEAAQAAETGKAQYLSCGYRCQLDMTPGTHTKYGPYDAEQKRIRYDHVALVAHGRAGSEARLNLDEADAEMIPLTDEPADDGEQQRTDSMATKIKLDGVDYEIPEQAAQAVTKMHADHEEKMTATIAERDEARKQAETEKARADAAEAAKSEIQTKLDEAAGPDRIKQAVNSRVALERDAAKVLGEKKATELKLDTLDDDAIKRVVVEHVLPKMRLDDASTERLTVAYEAALAHHENQPHPNLGTVRQRADAATGSNGTDLDAKQAAIAERNRKAYDDYKRQ